MRLAILGATGRTGRLLVQRAIDAGHHVQTLNGDALDDAQVRRALRGADAVVSCLGPRPGAPVDFCAQSTRVLIEAMQAEGIQRVVSVSGAMCGPQTELGRFYRAMTHVPALAHALDDRHAQEALLARSTLDWTLVRPPRLTDDAPSPSVRIEPHGPILLRAHCSRAQLADALLALVQNDNAVGQALYVSSEP